MNTSPAPFTVGHGPVRVIALHGWFGSGRAWQPYAGVADAERFTYVFPDYRGYGGRRGETGVYSMDEIARDTLALADRLGWRQFDLMGHSMGGKAIQKVLALAPDRVRRLVGVAPVPASGVPMDEQTWAFFASAADSREARQGIVAHSTGQRLSPAWVARIAAHSLEHSDKVAFGAYLTAWVKGDFSPDVQDRPNPVLVVTGEHDPALTADTMRATWLKTYPGARLEIMRNAGHYPADETPVALATVVEKFLSA